jgi:hypothetical protein
MNEYRVPELNVQNGVLKSLSFLFEYIGEMGKDYIYAVCPLLEDALMDRLVFNVSCLYYCSSNPFSLNLVIKNKDAGAEGWREKFNACCWHGLRHWSHRR